MNNINKVIIINSIIENELRIRAYGVKSLALFGSFSKNEFEENSDVDFLVNLNKATNRNYSGLKSFLESSFERKIDLVCENSLDERINIYILKDALWLVN